MRELKGQFAGALLLILTAAAIVVAAINFQQLHKFVLPDDGVTWVDRADAQGGPACRRRLCEAGLTGGTRRNTGRRRSSTRCERTHFAARSM